MATGTANPVRIELAASPPCEAFRPRFNQAAGSDKGFNPAKSDSRYSALIAFILAAALVGFATNLSMQLFNLRMQYAGVPELAIGVSVAIQALAIVITAPFTKHVISFFGVRTTLSLGALMSSAALIAFGFATDPVFWSLIRFIFAVGLALLFTTSESLVISRADSANRGRVVGWYATALATGTSAGPLLVMGVGIHGFVPLLCGAAFFALATMPIIAYLKPGEELAPVVRTSTVGTIRIAPIAFLSAFTFGVADNGGLAMLSVYGVLNGYDHANAVILTVFATAGAIVLQIPLGYFASRQDPRSVLLTCSFASMFLLVLLPHIIGAKPIAFIAAFGLGGVLEGLYTVGLICIAKYYRGIGISSANGLFVSMCGFGELVGPLATGASMDHLGAEGFVLGLTIILAVYIVLTVSIKQSAQMRTRHLHQSAAAVVPRTGPLPSNPRLR